MKTYIGPPYNAKLGRCVCGVGGAVCPNETECKNGVCMEKPVEVKMAPGDKWQWKSGVQRRRSKWEAGGVPLYSRWEVCAELESPTLGPTAAPSLAPTKMPSQSPTATPTFVPTPAPSTPPPNGHLGQEGSSACDYGQIIPDVRACQTTAVSLMKTRGLTSKRGESSAVVGSCSC